MIKFETKQLAANAMLILASLAVLAIGYVVLDKAKHWHRPERTPEPLAAQAPPSAVPMVLPLASSPQGASAAEFATSSPPSAASAEGEAASGLEAGAASEPATE